MACCQCKECNNLNRDHLTVSYMKIVVDMCDTVTSSYLLELLGHRRILLVSSIDKASLFGQLDCLCKSRHWCPHLWEPTWSAKTFLIDILNNKSIIPVTYVEGNIKWGARFDHLVKAVFFSSIQMYFEFISCTQILRIQLRIEAFRISQ